MAQNKQKQNKKNTHKTKTKKQPSKTQLEEPSKVHLRPNAVHTVSSLLLPRSVKSFLEFKFSITIAGVGPRGSHSQTLKGAWLGAEE